MIKAAQGLALGMSLVIALSGRWLLGLFSRDASIVALGSLLLWVDVLVQPAKAANIAITFSLLAAGDSRFPCPSQKFGAKLNPIA
jgi:Na+-driven multidrug efflux pump